MWGWDLASKHKADIPSAPNTLQFKFNLWVEALPLYEKGLLRLPPQTSLIMSDSGAGTVSVTVAVLLQYCGSTVAVMWQ